MCTVVWVYCSNDSAIIVPLCSKYKVCTCSVDLQNVLTFAIEKATHRTLYFLHTIIHTIAVYAFEDTSLNNTFLPSPNLSDARFSGDKHKVLGADRGAQQSRGGRVWDSTRTWLQHCWLWCWWSPASLREVRCFVLFLFLSEAAISLHDATVLTSYLKYEYNCVNCLCNSTPEEINSVWLPAENPREAGIRVFSWRLQHRGQRVCRAAGGGYGICKFSVISILSHIYWKLCCCCCCFGLTKQFVSERI